MTESETRIQIVNTAYMMARAGLAESFGHVSSRFDEGFVITTVEPFLLQTPDDLILVTDLDAPPAGGGVTPLETPMHAAVYRARPNVTAICRGHPPTVVNWGTGTEDLPLLHGLGAIAGEHVGIHPDVDLITSCEQADSVASSLGSDMCVILRSNGALAVGESLLEAVTRLFFLEERARVAMSTPRAATIDWGNRLRHTEPELKRAMTWMNSTFGDPK